MLPSLITLPLLLFVSLELTLLCEAKFSTSAQESKLVSFIQSKLTVHSPHESMVNDSVFPVLDLYQVVSVDENSEQLTVKIVLSFYYYVHDLLWNPNEYNGVTKMVFGSGTFWAPEIINEGIVEDIYTTESYQMVFSEGRVVTSHQLSIFVYHYNMEYALFPFDEQSCPLFLSAWGSKQGQYNMALNSMEESYRQLSLAHLTQNPQWEIRKPVTFHIEKYPDEERLLGGDDQEAYYDVLVVDLKLKRDPFFFLSVLIFPSFGVYILSSFVFILPVQSGEKITFASANLLAQVLTLGGEVATNLPRSSQHFPVFGNYMAFMIIHMASSLILTIFIYNIYFIGNNGREIPEWLDKILRDERLKYLFMPPLKTKQDLKSQSTPRHGQYSRMNEDPP